MSSTSVTIGSQTVTVTQTSIDQYRYQLSFNVKITAFNGNPVNQTIPIEIVCEPKTVTQMVNGNMVMATEAQTPQECVNNWLQQINNVYTFA